MPSQDLLLSDAALGTAITDALQRAERVHPVGDPFAFQAALPGMVQTLLGGAMFGVAPGNRSAVHTT